MLKEAAIVLLLAGEDVLLMSGTVGEKAVVAGPVQVPFERANRR